MIDAVDRRLEAWVHGVVGSVPVALTLAEASPDAADREGAGVACYLLAFAPKALYHREQPAPLQLSLRYLITTWAATALEAHRLLGELVFAAMADPEFDVDLVAPEPGVWQALGLVPQAAFVLQVPLRQAREGPATVRVREPLVVHTVPIGGLAGRVVGPSDRPLFGAHVTIPALQRTARTDAAGRFAFDGVPQAGFPLTLQVRANGHAATTFVAEGSPDMEPPTISLDLAHDAREEH